MNKFIQKITQIRWLQHILFWVLSVYFIGSYFSISNTFKSIDLVYSAFFHLSLLILVYVNIRILIPLLLEKNRYTIYFLLSLVLVAFTYGAHELIFEIAIPLLPIDYYIVSFTDPVFLIAIFSVYLVLSSLIKFSKSWFKVQKLQQDKLAMELESLRFQVNPHFLLNSLNNIYGLSLKKSDKAPEVILKLSNIMKHMLYQGQSSTISLESEISYLNDYVALQKLRVSENTNISMRVVGDNKDLQIAPFLLINFIENSFKHGLGGSIESPFVNMNIEIKESTLHFTCVNSIGNVDTTVSENSGLGLKNVRRRLELLYSDKHELLIAETEKEFSVNLSLNLT